MKKRRRYTAKQKAQIVLELLKEEKSVAQISSYGIHPNQLYRWKKQGTVQFHEVFEDRQKVFRELEQEHQTKVDQLYPEIGQGGIKGENAMTSDRQPRTFFKRQRDKKSSSGPWSLISTNP